MADEMATINDAIQSRLFGEAEESTEVIEDSEEIQDTQDDDQEVEADDVEEQDDVENEEEESDSGTELAEILGVDSGQVYVAESGEVMFNAKVDGEILPVSIKEMVKSFQLEKHVNNKSMELSARQKDFEEASNQAIQDYQSKLQMAEKVVELLEDELYNDIKSVDLDQLKATDPSRYLLVRDELAARVSKLNSVKEKLSDSAKIEQEQISKKQAEYFNQIVKSEYQKMISKHPDWADQKVFDKERQSMSTFLKESYGYTDQEINGIVDHRLIDIIADAKAYRAGKKEVSTKLSKPVPKFQKPGAGRDQTLERARAVKAKRAALKKSGSQKDLVNLLMDRM
jgi:hypothetical protein